ncbi:MAG: rRNA maturation RNase YbeY [Rhodobacteraceae bacterium]|nr:rRNA maturation RNase YbeY [Paracoccaceae bacterium]
MADNVAVLVDDDRWQTCDLDVLAEKALAAVLKERGIKPVTFDISLLACGDSKIAELNAEFRSKGQPTNVLSWPTFELAPETAGGNPQRPPNPTTPFCEKSLGDIAISYDTCLRESEEGHTRFGDHVCHLLVHSCLHLLGFDHETDADAARMEGIETKILASMGIKDPY